MGCIESLEMVNESTCHVEDLDVGSPAEVFEVQLHLSIVGVGDDAELGVGIGLVNAEEGTDQPIAQCFSLRVTIIVDLGIQPYGVCNKGQDIDSAL